MSTFIPLAPEINKANISSQFSQDTQDISEVFEKAEFTKKEREKDAKKGTAMKDGSFPIISEEDLRHAIKDVGRSNNPEAAKAHIKKRAAALGCTGSLPANWMKKGELDELRKSEVESVYDDELNMFNDELEKGGQGSGPHKKGDSVIIGNRNGGAKGTYIRPANDSGYHIVQQRGQTGVSKLPDHQVHAIPDNEKKIKKSTEDVLSKGEGSRGGKVIGHTKSGKPIYAKAGIKDYPDFTAEDHDDAGVAHFDRGNLIAAGKHGRASEKMGAKKEGRKPHAWQGDDKDVKKYEDSMGFKDSMKEHKERQKSKNAAETEQVLRARAVHDSEESTPEQKMKARKFLDSKKKMSKSEDEVEKSFEDLLNISSDPVESAFRSLNLVETDPITKAFEDVLSKGEGSRGGKIVGHTKAGRPIYDNGTVKAFGKHVPIDVHSKIDHISRHDTGEDEEMNKIFVKHGVNEGYDTEHQLHDKYHSGEMTRKKLNLLHNDVKKHISKS